MQFRECDEENMKPLQRMLGWKGNEKNIETFVTIQPNSFS